MSDNIGFLKRCVCGQIIRFVRVDDETDCFRCGETVRIELNGHALPRVLDENPLGKVLPRFRNL